MNKKHTSLDLNRRRVLGAGLALGSLGLAACATGGASGP